jgi:hypothetical protein
LAGANGAQAAGMAAKPDPVARALDRLVEAAPAWMPASRCRWLAALAGSARIAPPLQPRSAWRYACCHGCAAALLLPRAADEAFAAAVTTAIGDERPRDAAIARALDAAAWLLALKRMRAPGTSEDPPLTADRLRGLGLGAEGLVEAIAGLGEAVDHGRRLARAALEHAALARRRNR